MRKKSHKACYCGKSWCKSAPKKEGAPYFLRGRAANAGLAPPQRRTLQPRARLWLAACECEGDIVAEIAQTQAPKGKNRPRPHAWCFQSPPPLAFVFAISPLLLFVPVPFLPFVATYLRVRVCTCTCLALGAASPFQNLLGPMSGSANSAARTTVSTGLSPLARGRSRTKRSVSSRWMPPPEGHAKHRPEGGAGRLERLLGPKPVDRKRKRASAAFSGSTDLPLWPRRALRSALQFPRPCHGVWER
jgi:hypothetical protein